MPVSPTTLDVHFLPVNQQAPSTIAPPGRLAKMVDSVAAQFEGHTLKVQARKGFRQYTKKVVDPTSNEIVTATNGFSDTPELLSSLERQLLVVSDNNPYVLAENGDEWARHPYVIHPNTTRQRPIYTSNVQIKDCDSAVAGDVVCFTYKQSDPVTNVVSAWVIVKDLDGTVLMSPHQLGSSDPAMGQTCQIKVVSDGSRFWVFQSYTSTAKVDVILTDGTFSGSSSFTTIFIDDSSNVAWWDIQHNPMGVCWFGSTVPSFHALYTFMWSPGTITPVLTSFEGTITISPTRPFWLVNPYDPNHAYLGLAANSSPAEMWIERFTPSKTRDLEFIVESGFTFDSACEFSGYVDQTLTVTTLRSMLSSTDSVFNYTFLTEMTSLGSLHRAGSMPSVTAASRVFFLNDHPTSIMYFTDGEQPTFFLHDLRSLQMCGMWSHGTSAQDWQGVPGDVNQLKNYDAFHLPSPYVDIEGSVHCAIAFMAESFSRNFVTFTRTGTNPIVAINNSRFVSTIGLADVEWSNPGRATEYADELMIPGTQATCFSGSLFTEDNFNLFPSKITVDQSHNDAGNLDLGGEYSIVVVFESTDTRGNRVKSRPSAPFKFTMSGANNIATITGPTLFETNGKSNVVISIYSTYNVSSAISTDHRKVTDDLIPLLNDKGSLTWSFIFNKTSAEIQLGEILYTDNALLPHDPCPAHSTGCIAGNRMFVAGWDGAIWYSDEKEEGQPLVFNLDVRRVLMPTSDPVISMEALDTMRIIVLCSKSVWEFDISQLPGPDGLNGNVQTPKRLPFTNGCNLLSAVVKEGIIYTSDAGGIWLVSRGLENQQVSGPEYKDLFGLQINGMATDSKQRTFIGIAKSDHFVSTVRDGINFAWSSNTHPRKIVLVHSFGGNIVYSDDVSVHHQDESTYDTYRDDETNDIVIVPINPDVTIEPLNFGTVKGLKCIWKFILHGEYFGAHSIIIDATYDTEDGVVTESWTTTPSPSNQYDFQFEPMAIEMNSIALRIRSNHAEGDHDLTFELESLSFEVGIDSYLNRIPSYRTPSST